MDEVNDQKLPAFEVARIRLDMIPESVREDKDKLDTWLTFAVDPVWVYSDRERALRECARLNQINGAKGYLYLVRHTRFASGAGCKGNASN